MNQCQLLLQICELSARQALPRELGRAPRLLAKQKPLSPAADSDARQVAAVTVPLTVAVVKPFIFGQTLATRNFTHAHAHAHLHISMAFVNAGTERCALKYDITRRQQQQQLQATVISGYT